VAAPLARPRAERLLGWLYTGPLGHLYSAVADITVLWLRWAALRLRERAKGPLQSSKR
jgi:hypothetical protein